ERPLVLFVDALDQLSDVEQARDLSWLPTEVPEHVRLVVSSLPGACLAALEARVPEPNLRRLEPLPEEEARPLLERWLEDAGRPLQQHQLHEVLAKFDRSTPPEERGGPPLYLKLAFEEARRWHSYTPPAETALTEGIEGIIGDLFERLSDEANHGPTLVA